MNRYRRRRFLAAFVLVAAASALGGCDLGADPPPASLTITDLDLVAGQDSARFKAVLENQFSEAVLDALHNGVSLTFVWDLELIAERDFVWDSRVWSTGGSRRVSYRPLSQRYTMATAGEAATSYPDMERVLGALSGLDVVVDLPRSQLEAVARPYFRFRSRLDIAALPPPLRLPSYLSAAWRLDSGWRVFHPG